MNINIMNKLNTHQSGFTLVELMVAMVIGLLLMSGALSLFISNQQIYREQNEIGLLQENARFTMELLHKDIRRSTFVGCVDDTEQVVNQINGLIDTDIASLNNTVPLIEGSESGANWQPSNSTEGVATMAANTDGITVRYLKSTGISVTAPMNTRDDDLTTDGDSGLIQGSYVAVGNCAGTDIFRISNDDANDTGIIEHQPGMINGDPGNASADFFRVYGEADTGLSQIYQLANYRYYIADSDNGTGSALWRWTPAGAEELVEGVENLQILYGEDTTGDGASDSFVDGATVNDWSNVMSVKLAVLMRTVDENTSNDVNNTVYNLLGTNVGPMNDRHRRRVFTQTIEIRNRR
jgi:type IV pilus assembly protein PilW